ncbi:GntR family transcriptional regulator [Chitinophaga japonensis]|uniref:GntR family transcriptional regulator n=2 Tax=Chitinophaga japonensis TaxID=104662 RepID=A0A562T0I7_CHIJA|nr:GntR family transcriptional regulator [Chitinophaga japonensis]
MFEHSYMDLKINHKSKLPLHIQVEELLRNLVSQPEYQNGAFLPKEVELANRLGVSRNTIRQAANKLEYEGLLVRKKGVGTKVVRNHLSTSLHDWQSFTKEMSKRGIVTSNLLLTLENVKAGEKIAAFFNIAPGTSVCKLSKLKGVDGEPIVYFESYFHPRITLTENDDLNRPLYQLLSEKFGIVVVRSSEHISALMAGKVAKKLQVDPKSPILFRERFVYDPGDRPVEYNVGYYRSDKFTYSIEIRSEA